MSQVREFDIVADFRDNTVGIVRGGKLTCFGKQAFRKSPNNKSLSDYFALRARNNVLFRCIHNSHLFLKNGTFGRSQNLGMFKSDTRKHDEIAACHRRTVEAAAHSRFHGNHIYALFRVIEERHQGQHFKKSRLNFSLHRCITHAEKQAIQILVADGRIVDADAFTEADQVRARKKAGLEPVSLQNARQVVARGPLAVRTDNVDGLELGLRISENFAKFSC